MNSRRQILLAHYTIVLRKVASWAALAALVSTTFVAGPAGAYGTQAGARSVTPGTLKAGSTSTYAASFTPGTTGVVGSMKFELCDSPLETVTCASNTTTGLGSYGDSFVGATVSVSGSGWTAGTWTTGAIVGPASGTGLATSVLVANSGTANAPTTAQPATISITNVLNPNGNAQKYYLRVTTFATIAYGTEVDYGAMALETAQDIVVSAQVQETLMFCTGATVGSGCGSIASGAISLGTGSNCPVLSTSNNCTGTNELGASTNAQGGYSITYNGTNLSGAGDTVTATGSPGAVSTINTKQFGLSITGQVGSGTKVAVYDFTASTGKYAYVVGTPTQIATGTAANGEAVYTVKYMANVDSTQKAGAYTATINYVCTGLF